MVFVHLLAVREVALCCAFGTRLHAQPTMNDTDGALRSRYAHTSVYPFMHVYVISV